MIFCPNFFFQKMGEFSTTPVENFSPAKVDFDDFFFLS